MSGSLSHPNIIRDFPSRTRWVMRYVAEDQTMICNKGPLGGRRLLQGEGSKPEISFKGSESITVEQKSQQPISRFLPDNSLSYVYYQSFCGLRDHVCKIN